MHVPPLVATIPIGGRYVANRDSPAAAWRDSSQIAGFVEVDAKLSTIERYAAAIGQRVEFHLAEDRRPGRRSA